MLHLVVTAAEAGTNFRDFLDSLRVTSTCSDEVAEAIPVLKREMGRSDVIKLVSIFARFFCL